MTKILILHGINYYNAGDHGIVQSMCSAIRRSIPDAQIKVASPFLANIDTDQDFVRRTKEGFKETYPEEISDLYQVPVGKKRKARVLFYAIKILFYVISLTLLPYPLKKTLARTTQFGTAVLDADLVLSKGGGFLLDRGTTYTIPTHLMTIWISVLLRKKTIIYAQSIGPFENAFGRAIAKLVLRRVTHILPRDQYSETYAKDTLGVSSEKISLTADSAFDLTSSVIEKPATLKSGSSKKVCITLVSPRYSGLPDQDAEDKYCTVIANLAEHIANKNYDIVFIPHLESGNHSDRILAQRIYNQCSSITQAVTEILAPTNPVNIINLMAQCDLAVCSRMHSMIFAIDAKLPFLALSYLPKSDSMLSEADLNEWKLSLADLAQNNVDTSSAAIIAKFETMLENLANNRKKVAAANEYFVTRARTSTDLLTEILNQTD
jgi:colanic acid/amylovoran biosynthesis protein